MMNVWAHSLRVLTALFYILAFVAAMAAFFRGGRESARKSSKRSDAFILAAFAIQTAGLLWEGFSMRRCPLGSMADALQIVSWSLVVVYGIVGAAYRMSLLGLFTSALAAFFALASTFFGGEMIFRSVSAMVLVHGWLSLFSYGVFGFMAIVSAMYLIQLYGLKKRRLTPLFNRLPSLRELDRVNFRLLVASVGVYSAAVFIGAWRYFSSGGNVSAAKLILASAVWLGYVFALLFRFLRKLRGRRLAYALVAVFLLALAVLIPIGLGHSADANATPAGEVVR